jgi:hypothetical protein
MIHSKDNDLANNPIKHVSLQYGGHMCTTGCRPIVMCELGLSPIWCPRPKKYTFVARCKQCKLYFSNNSNDFSFVDNDEIYD